MNYKFLNNINTPADLKKLSEKDLKEVCDELRDFLIHHGAEHGGHFASSLGVVELTVALHYIFNTPNDRLVWDVGHQAYGHKVLTGRRDIFPTNRKKDGMSGFPKRGESKFDAFVAGHSSISISAALGMAVASKLKKENRSHIAIIGDGAMTGGIAFEGLNNAAVANADILVILNDNQISIDPNVGAMTKVLVDLSTSGLFNKFRYGTKDFLRERGEWGKKLERFVARSEKIFKNIVFRDSNFFESLGFRYFGIIDGNDIKTLTKTLRDIKRIPGPKILHILTKKGKGFAPAEKEQTKWHATSGFDLDPEVSKKSVQKVVKLKYQEIFGHTMCDLASENEKIVGITPAMLSGSSLDLMQKKIPTRVFDVGIAEQHAVTFSAGLAVEGLIPFCNIYSSFAQRAYDQIIHDVCIEKTPVIFCLDRAGFVGEDGETHHGVFDLSFLLPIPNLIIASPMNESELRNLMYTAQKQRENPFVIRYPRGAATGQKNWRTDFSKIEIGKGREISKGKKIAVLSLGTLGNSVEIALKNLSSQKIIPAHFDMRFAKPLDEELLLEIAQDYTSIITIEEGILTGGFGSTVADFLRKNNQQMPVHSLGIPDKFIPQGTVTEQREICGLDIYSIEKIIKELWKK